MQKREPFSAMGLLKSPMGLMIGFMVVCVFLLPKLMDQIGMQTTDLSTEIFFTNECGTMCHCHQYNHKENLSYNKTSKSMSENRCCRPRMFIVDPNKRTSGSSAGITLASLQ